MSSREIDGQQPLDTIEEALARIVSAVRHGESPKDEFGTLDSLLSAQDVAVRLVNGLGRQMSPGEVVAPRTAIATPLCSVWVNVGELLFRKRRYYEAAGVFAALYEHMMNHQTVTRERVHKGRPLYDIARCHSELGRRVLAKRYMMLALVEDAITGEGRLNLEETGSYLQLVWLYGLSDGQVTCYVEECWRLYQENGEYGAHPEWILQKLDQEWKTESPSDHEVGCYLVSMQYCAFLLGKLGSGTGKDLEWLTEYFVASMPGCRAYLRRRSLSTDYDVIGAFEGPLVDFRSELGRYFVCECKDQNDPADFTDIAKFCRVLDSTKARFGILVSKKGITGYGKMRDADLERLKVYQDRGIVIVVVDEGDLWRVARGANLISLLREKYENVRLNLRGSE